MSHKMASLILASSLTVLLGYYLPMPIDQQNDNAFKSISILDDPQLLQALRDMQSRGILMGIHGYKHEDFSAITPLQARNAVNDANQIFLKAGLSASAFLDPYLSLDRASNSVMDAINSTGVAMDLSHLRTDDSVLRDYGTNWRNMKSFDDTRFSDEHQRIVDQQPTAILLHVQDWNPFLKSLICDYLEHTSKTGIYIRIDDVEVNTPPEKIYDLAVLKKYPSVDRVVLGVISMGYLKEDEELLFGLSVNSIFRVYWWYYMLFAFFPTAFFVSWRLLSFKERASEEDDLASLPGGPKEMSVSVVIPAYNEEANLAHCLDSIDRQDFRGSMEVIVVNDGSTDRTGEIASKYPMSLMELEKNLGKAQALNLGIMKSKNDIIIFSDSDSQLADDAVSALVRCLAERPDVHAVAGEVLVRDCLGKNNILQCFQRMEYHFEQDVNRFLQSLSGGVLVCPGPLFAIRREVIDVLRFSDLTVVEDADFTIRAQMRSMKVIQEPKAMVYTCAPRSIGGWIAQRKRWWYGNLQLWDIYNHWAKRNPWMLLNYFGFINSLVSVLLLLFLPILLMRIDDLWVVLQSSLAYLIVPLMLSCLMMAPFFRKEIRLMPMLLPYCLIYLMMKTLVVCYLYICYLSGIGVDIRFGPRTLRVR